MKYRYYSTAVGGCQPPAESRRLCRRLSAATLCVGRLWYSIRMLALPLQAFEHGVLAAVSGGADSVVLLHLLAEACPHDGKLAAAHIHHGLRGADSDDDAAFVKTLTETYQLRYFEHRLDAGKNISENTARNLRYDVLVNQAEHLGFRYLATAHTADDQTETVLHRILRGTGLSGLSGIMPVRTLTPAVTLLRPMLHVRRKAIIAYLESLGKTYLGQTYRDDKTNFENHFTRNRIRNRLLPTLRAEYNPKIDEAVCRLAMCAADNESVLSELFDEIIASACLERLPNRVVLDTVPLQHYSLPVLREIVIRVWKLQQFPMREMDYAHWTSLAELFRGTSGCLYFPGGITAERTLNRYSVYI